MIRPTDLYSTFSIVAHDPATGQLGVAVQTHQMCVGAHIIWMEPGVGAAITQAMANLKFGPLAIALLREGLAPNNVIDGLVATDPGKHQRQVAVITNEGEAAAWTGDNCIREAAHHVGEGYSVQANMMTNPTVVPAMAEAFEKAGGDLAARLMAALQAAQAEGGDIRGMQSAALKVVPGEGRALATTAVYDLRVDEHADPVTELARLVRLRRAQHVDRQGYQALEAGDRDQALAHWAEARSIAPDLEEIAYWQAITLADNHDAIDEAADILKAMLASDADQRDHWVDLVRRLVDCGVIEHKDRADALLTSVQN